MEIIVYNQVFTHLIVNNLLSSHRLIIRVLVHFFSLPLIFTLHLIGGRLHFPFCHRHYKISMLFFQQKKCLLFLTFRSRSLSPFFSLSFSGLPPAFSISLSFSCSIFQICGHDNYSKLNTLDNTNSETTSTFRFRLY